MQDYKKIHPGFRLNGSAYGSEELKEVSYSLVKEGDEHEKEIGDFLLDWISEGEKVEVITSGSSGSPVKHWLPKAGMLQSALATAEYLGLEAGDTAFLCLPSRYIAAKMMLVRAMVIGLSLDYAIPSSRPLKDVAKSYDFSAMVPFQFLESLDKMCLIRKLIIGGAPLGAKGTAAAQGLDTEIYETFGMTETISHIALRRVNPPDPLFHTLAGITVALDQRGCLLIQAPNIVPAAIRTNDLARLSSDRTFEWLGRLDNVINSAGIKLVPEQIEDKIQPVIGNRFFLAGAPDELLGEKLILIVEGDLDVAALSDDLKKLNTLSKFEVPKEIHVVQEFLLTGSGKVNRAATLSKFGFGRAQ